MSEQIEALLEGPREITLTNGKTITLRPFTFGSLGLCKKMGLTMFSGSEEDEALNEDESMQQLQAFFWMQSQPVNDVLGAIRQGTWQDAVEEFGFVLPLHEMQTLMAEMNRISGMVREAAVDVLPKGDDDTDKDAPGN